RSIDIRRVRRPRILERPRDAWQCSDMKYDIDPSDGAATHLELAEIATQKLNLARQAAQICFIPRAEIVHHPNVVSQTNKVLSEMRADEAGSPRHQAL